VYGTQRSRCVTRVHIVCGILSRPRQGSYLAAPMRSRHSSLSLSLSLRPRTFATKPRASDNDVFCSSTLDRSRSRYSCASRRTRMAIDNEPGAPNTATQTDRYDSPEILVVTQDNAKIRATAITTCRRVVPDGYLVSPRLDSRRTFGSRDPNA